MEGLIQGPGRAPQHDDPDAREPELLRCYYCRHILIMHKETGYDVGCPECGSRRLRNVGPVRDEEMRDLIARGFDDSGWTWVPDDKFKEGVKIKREIDHKFQVKKAARIERDENLRKRDRLAEMTYRLGRGF